MGTIKDAYRVCLWSRLATRVLWPIARFPARDAQSLYDGVRDVPWEDHLGVDRTVVVDARAVRSNLTHTHFAALKVKDALVDRFRDLTGRRPSVDLRNPDVRINLYVFRNEATLSIDLSGHGLHQRGYRQAGHEAPVRENLAAALLMQAGWPTLEGPLLDPMCGSGTFIVEGALMAAGIAPGLIRKRFGFQAWSKHSPTVWEKVRSEAEAERRPIGRPIVGYDVDQESVSLAKRHASRAGVGELVLIEQRDMASLSGLERLEPGLVITNPPYGKRLGKGSRIDRLYAELGERLKTGFPGWSVGVFTGNPELCSNLRLRPRRSYSFDNGGIESKLLLYRMDSRKREIEESGRQRQEAHLRQGSGGQAGGRRRGDASPRSGETPSVRANVRMTSSASSVEMFANRLRKNARHFGKWARRQKISCYRVYDADLPDFPFAVDQYSGADGRWAHVQVYESAQLDETRIETSVHMIESVLEIPAGNVIVKTRRRQRGYAQYDRLSDEGQEVVVEETPARFLVNLRDYLDTGLFLDNRLIRSQIGGMAEGTRFLNLFGYTGSATVHAALGGAAETTTVDLSNSYLDWARRNLDLNDVEGSAHTLVRDDCLAWLETASSPYDLIFLDPPTFSNSTSMTTSFDVQRDHADVIVQAANLLSSDGSMIFSCNRKGFRLDAALREAYGVRDLSASTLSKDFERRRMYHHCYEIRK